MVSVHKACLEVAFRMVASLACHTPAFLLEDNNIRLLASLDNQASPAAGTAEVFLLRAVKAPVALEELQEASLELA
ncbi:hypothetical protein D3C84_1231930 [compost metagenome]